MTPTTIYLVLYNTVQLLGWAWLAKTSVRACTSTLLTTAPWARDAGADAAQCHAATLPALTLLHALMALELLHALVGIVRSAPRTIAGQLTARFFLTFVVVRVSGQSASAAFAWMLVAWTPTELVRYAFYVANLALGSAPGVLTLARYTLFLVLYPLGFAAEWAQMWQSLASPDVGALSSVLTYALLALWPLGLFIQYSHMLRQRSAALGRR